MEANAMEDRRRFSRFGILLDARYSVENGSDTMSRCTIINMNHKGIGIRFHTHEVINVGAIVHLEIFVSDKLKFTSVKGKLKWNKKRENGHSAGGDGGIECDKLLDEMQLSQSEKTYPTNNLMQ
jgi:hypothetical protein